MLLPQPERAPFGVGVTRSAHVPFVVFSAFVLPTNMAMEVHLGCCGSLRKGI